MQDTDGPPASIAPKTGVTVVVPAYNPGRYLERCVLSLLDQTLDRSRYDVIVVDDGSTDGTARWLDRRAEKHPDLIRVEHIPNSGWPGRPRNLGTDLAEREYVFYCDADDWLLPHALEIMLDRATADGADILLARPIGNRRAVGLALFERGDFCSSVRETPAIFSTLTCQKLFRREFLREQHVRFTEGKVRLEDFIFMTAAYLRAERITVVGSQPCYVFERRDDGGNLTATPPSEADYFASVEKIVDLVVAETVPGDEQDRLLDRVVYSELIGPLSRPTLLRKTPAAQAEALEHGRRVLMTKVPPSAVARQDPLVRSNARAIERGDLAAILRTIAAREAVSASIVATGVAWAGNTVRVEVRLALELDGAVVALQCAGDVLELPGALGGHDPADVRRAFARSTAHVHVRSRDRSEEWRVAVQLTAVPVGAGGPPLEWTGVAVIDPFSLAAGHPLRGGVWDLHLTMTGCGFRRSGRVRAGAGSSVAADPVASLTRGELRVRPYWTKASALSLTVRTPGDRSPARRAGPGRIARGVRRRAWSATRSWRRRARVLVRRFAARAGRRRRHARR